MKQSDGSIWVYSEPGVGTTFSIYLPRVDDGANLPQEPAPSHASLRGSETILVVEDQDQLRKMAVRVLRDYGYRVIESANPEDALLTSERHPGPIDPVSYTHLSLLVWCMRTFIIPAGGVSAPVRRAVAGTMWSWFDRNT